METEHQVDIKQRIVGAIVLVSLAIIILPIYFGPKDDSHKYFKVNEVPAIPSEIQQTLASKQQQLKQRDKMPVLPVPKAIPVDDKNKSQVKNTQIEATKHKSHYKNAQKPKDKTISHKYTLQLGSFSLQENAFNLRNKLRAKKFKAYIEQITIDKKINYRVRVGPYLKYDQITSIHKKIKKSFKINAKIISL